jgi:hypothetical protein
MWLPKWFVLLVTLLATLNAVTHYPDFKEGLSLITQDVKGLVNARQ